MSVSCSKVRLFNLLLVFCLGNFLLFRNYFQQTKPNLPVTALPGFNLTLYNSTEGNVQEKVRSAATSPIVDNQQAGLENHTRSFGNSSLSFPSVPPFVWDWSSFNLEKANATSNSSAGASNVSKSANGDAAQEVNSTQRETGGPLLTAFDKVVTPRANVTAPWAPDNTTSLCPVTPPLLVGALATYLSAPSVEEIVKLNPGLEPGGHFHPPNCRARSKIAIIVPYRNREEHLRILLHNLHPILQRQQLDYFILVVDQAGSTKFNRGMLLNIGAVEALGLWDVDCFIFHDVDLVPENDKNIYSCPDMPRHMSAAVDKFGYKLPYTFILGGVTAMRREQFYKINGYSNVYFGWGGEDDDLATRVNSADLKITRYPLEVARYKMIKHERDIKNEPNPQRFYLLHEWKKRQSVDGLNSLVYTVDNVEFRPGYTWIQVSVNLTDILEPLGPMVKMPKPTEEKKAEAGKKQSR